MQIGAPGNAGKKIVRIGGASGFWGDSAVGATQLVSNGAIDYLVFDYLAELTMALLASARRKNPDLGYATDFVDTIMVSILPEVKTNGIKVVTNAGGINPAACARALAKVAADQGIELTIAVVEGDDVSGLIPALREAGQADMFSGAPLPEKILSANAYLGALPVARALAMGADVVITGRCVDSAVTLGPLIHEFGWSPTDYDKLAAGSLAGHIIECGCQATGGLFTDWDQVPGWDNIGYPIAECSKDGSFVVTKPAGTGGLVAAAAVAEQLVYEIGDPGAYILPDVVCDFRQVRIEQAGENRVAVSGARGLPPPDTYKVSTTYMDGFRAAGTMVIVGRDAVAKAMRTGEAILARTRALFRAAGLPDYSATRVEAIGGESIYGPLSRASQAREVTMRVAVNHRMKEALDIFAREIAPSGTSWAPGTTSPGFVRPSASPLIKQIAFALPKHELNVRVTVGERSEDVPIPVEGGFRPAPAPEPDLTPVSLAQERVSAPLIDLAYARSGDKGDISNIGVIARRPEYLPVILEQVTPVAVKAHFAHLVQGEVTRYLLPGISACNFVLTRALDGGGTTSLRLDPLGKGMGQMLLDMEILVPRDLPGICAATQQSGAPNSNP